MFCWLLQLVWGVGLQQQLHQLVASLYFFVFFVGRGWWSFLIPRLGCGAACFCVWAVFLFALGWNKHESDWQEGTNSKKIF
jgi:hypothetical protein